MRYDCENPMVIGDYYETNAKLVGYCKHCNNEIYEGQTVYKVWDNMYCDKDCILSDIEVKGCTKPCKDCGITEEESSYTMYNLDGEIYCMEDIDTPLEQYETEAEEINGRE